MCEQGKNMHGDVNVSKCARICVQKNLNIHRVPVITTVIVYITHYAQLLSASHIVLI